jgi:hypothetical protein
MIIQRLATAGSINRNKLTLAGCLIRTESIANNTGLTQVVATGIIVAC